MRPRHSHKSIYLSEQGDVMQYKGNTADMAEHEQRRNARDRRR